jgi:hypothetical protein
MTTYILGISAFYHDSAACLLRDGHIVAVAQEERFTRKKHYAGFPSQSVRYCLRQVGTLLVISAFVSPTSLRVVYRGWMALGQALGWFNTRIILGVVFYLLVTPMGLLMRLAGKDPMRRRYAPEADTYV